MLHLSGLFDDSFFSEKNEVTTSGSVFFGCYCYYHFITVEPALIFINWEVIITLLKAGMALAIGPIISSFSKQFYEEKIGPLIFKTRQNAKEKRKKTENKKRA